MYRPQRTRERPDRWRVQPLAANLDGVIARHYREIVLGIGTPEQFIDRRI